MKRHVALLVETSSIYGRELLSGIVRHMRMHDEWSVYLEQRDLLRQPPAWLASWEGDGIISRATTPRLVEAVQATGVPLVELTDRREGLRRPTVRSDDAAIGRLAASHLLERGFQHFGYCGFRQEAWSHRREVAFREAVEAAGGTCGVFNSPWYGPSTRSWEDEREQLLEWLKALPRPCGVLAGNDIRGQHVLDAASRAGLAVPEEVAVLGVDDDDLLCRISTPPLSSVIPDAAGVGFRAAELLSRLMDGDDPGEVELLVPPVAVATRQSTDVVAIPDAEMAAALHHIRQHACRGLEVDRVLESVPISRSSLERKMRKYLGRTPQQEIRRVQVERVKELLATTDLPVEEIARLCGFEHTEYLYVVFKRLVGQTPGEYRRQTHPE